MQPTKSQKPNGIYDQAMRQKEQAEEAMGQVSEYATECVQSHPMSTLLATFAIGMVAGTCLVSLLMQPEQRTWRDEASDWGNSMAGKMRRFVPDFQRS